MALVLAYDTVFAFNKTFAAASDKVYQLLAHGRWFSLGTPASSTIKTGHHDIAESGVNHQKSNQIINKTQVSNLVHTMSF